MPSIKELKKICQKSEGSPSWRSQSFEGRLNRVFSIYLTWIFIKTPITPNQITFIGVIFYLIGAFLFIFNSLTCYIIGLFLMFFSFVLDACDGEVARYKQKIKGVSLGGIYVEPISHDIMYAFFFLPIGIGQSLFLNNLLPLVAGFVATASKLLFRLAELRYNITDNILSEQKGEPSEFEKNKKTPDSLAYFIYRNLSTNTGIFTILLFAVILNRIDLFLYFYAGLFFLLWVFKMFRQWKKITN